MFTLTFYITERILLNLIRAHFYLQGHTLPTLTWDKTIVSSSVPGCDTKSQINIIYVSYGYVCVNIPW